ncbi:MAG TPA: type II toxin-antitoxin system VapC family toxin [Longimicrobiaceae bacterium]|nr:type II toxin-antitoxin system VapC family toxin [Longimicrobiaceae bacterium]
MPLFLDACVLAKRYLPEQLSSRRVKEITGRFDRWGGFVVSSFIELEVISAFAKYAREHPTYAAHMLRRHPAAVDHFRKELSHAAFEIVQLDEDLLEEAADYLRLHPEYSIHAGDAVHLMTAIKVRARLAPGQVLVFVTADAGLEAAARAEGFATVNPMREGIEALLSVRGLERN